MQLGEYTDALLDERYRINGATKAEKYIPLIPPSFWIGATPLGRLGQPADIAAVVVFLVSDAAAWLTGERIRASGGLQ